MSAPTFVIFYVQSPTASAKFYTDLLGQPPLDASDNFAMFAINPNLMLGLWARHDVQPPVTAAPGGVELAFSEADVQAVNLKYESWRAKGLKIAQAPTAMDFGHTFVALDPDGHRLRVMAQASA